jgi:hypothetical protein
MCVLLCVNSKTHEWMERPFAIAYRQSLQLWSLCPDESHECGNPKTDSVRRLDEQVDIEDDMKPRVMNRSTWIQAYFSYREHKAQGHLSTQDWHQALELIAKTWNRLLFLVGLRR